MASLGGILKAGLGIASRLVPGVAQAAGVYTAAQGAHRMLKQGSGGGTLPAIGSILNAGPRINLPGAMDRKGDKGIFGFGGGGQRKYRRMNPMNIKAARRAIRRIQSGQKLMSTLFTVTRRKESGVNIKRQRKR